MLITENFIFFELQKTGCSHTKEILAALSANNNRDVGVHNSYDSVSAEDLGDFQNKLKVGNVRNPWDWYVSLWSYGSMKRGRLYSKVSYKPDFKTISGIKVFTHKLWKTKSLRHVFYPNQWHQVYSDPYNPEYFRAWLKMVLTEEKLPISDGYKNNRIWREIGYLTYLYLRLYNYDGRKMMTRLKNYEEALIFDKQNNFMDLIIRNELIHDKLVENADDLGFSPDCVKQMLADHFQKKSNASKRKGDYRQYYDDESIELVRDKDRLIIDKYGYEF